MKERVVKARVKKLLDKHGCYYFMPVQSGYGAATLDFLGCHRGRFFAVETKAPKKHPTARQKLIMEMMSDAGGAVFVVGEEYSIHTDTFSGMAELEAWLVLGR